MKDATGADQWTSRGVWFEVKFVNNEDGTWSVSLYNYNTKQLNIGSVAKPVQKMFYIDNEGCITFTSGACVNNFTLEKPIRVLLNSRLVNLFKLFKDELVQFNLGYDPLSETIIQTNIYAFPLF